MAYYRHHSSEGSLFGFGIVLVFLIGSAVMYFLKCYGKKKRAEKLKNLATKYHCKVIPHLDKVFEDGANIACFSIATNQSYYNVIEHNDESMGKVFVGEYSYRSFENGRPSRRSRYNSLNGGYYCVNENSQSYRSGYEKIVSLCVLYDKRLMLPNFELRKETIGLKAGEVLGLNKFNDMLDEDIDFENDKAFSDAWWLSSNENMLMPSLFTSTVRSGFMKFVGKGYRIGGNGTMLVIRTDKVYDPEDYGNLVQDIREMQRILRTNRKYVLQEEPPSAF